MKKVKKIIRKKVVTKAAMAADIKAQAERLTWANRIITLQQGEIDRLITQVAQLTGAISNMAKDN